MSTDPPRKLRNPADSILSLLYYRHQSAIAALDTEYVRMLDDALCKVRRLTMAEERRHRDSEVTR